MKNSIILLFSLLFFTTYARSQDVASTEVANVAKTFMQWSDKDISSIKLHDSKEFYIVQSLNKGWILISSIRKMHPIIGYSEKGNISIDN